MSRRHTARRFVVDLVALFAGFAAVSAVINIADRHPVPVLVAAVVFLAVAVTATRHRNTRAVSTPRTGGRQQ